MGRYRKIECSIWGDPLFRKLPERSQFLYLFLMTHPHMTSIGAMRSTIPGLAAERQWSQPALRQALKPLRPNQVELDEAASCLVVWDFLAHNPPENPNVIKSWEKLLPDIPQCQLLFDYLERVSDRLPEGLRQWLPKGFGKGMPISESESENESETNRRAPRSKEIEREILEWFERDFVAQYPEHRRVQLPTARAEIVKLRPDETLRQKITASLAAWKVSAEWARESGAYVPGMGKFLKDRRFDLTPKPGEGVVKQPEGPPRQHRQFPDNPNIKPLSFGPNLGGFVKNIP